MALRCGGLAAGAVPADSIDDVGHRVLQGGDGAGAHHGVRHLGAGGSGGCRRAGDLRHVRLEGGSALVVLAGVVVLGTYGM